MLTVLFYSALIIISTIFVWLGEKGKTQLVRLVFFCVAFLLVFVPSAIRYDIGTDYLNYISIYDDSIKLNFYKHKEPLFYFVNWFLGILGLEAQWAIGVFAFIFTFVVFKAYPDRKIWLLHFLFFSALWLFSFNGVRQAVALSFCIFAVYRYIDGRYISFVVISLLACLFHNSAIFFLFLGLISFIPVSNYFKVKVFPLCFVLLPFFVYFQPEYFIVIVGDILNVLGFETYANYFSSSVHFSEVDFGSGLAALVKITFSLYVILNSKSLLYVNKRYWFVIITTFVYCVSVVLASKFIIFGRLADVFVVAPLVAAHALFLSPVNYYLNRLVVVCFLVFMFAVFIKMSLGVVTPYGNPKLNPYMSIFS